MLINQARVRTFALELVKQKRAKQFTRVSPSFLQRIDQATKDAVYSNVHKHPSVGITLK